MLRSGIYSIECKANGRRYIGSAVNIAKRWKEHRRSLDAGTHHSRFLMREWNKRGPDAFIFSVLLYCGRDNLLMYEQACLDGFKPEYNSAPTAGSQLGLKMSDAAKAKMSQAAKRTRNFTGKNHTDESKAKISRKKTGVIFGPYGEDRIKKTADAMRNSKNALTEDQVRLIRKWNCEGQQHKYSAALLGCSYWVVADVVRNRTFGWVK